LFFMRVYSCPFVVELDQHDLGIEHWLQLYRLSGVSLRNRYIGH
jgi:hypothetical protein